MFDFIRENTVEVILDLKIKAIIENLDHDKGIKLVIETPFKDYLINKAKGDMSDGGRGISNMVETYLINPLSDVLIKEDWSSGDSDNILDKSDKPGVIFDYRIFKDSHEDNA